MKGRAVIEAALTIIFCLCLCACEAGFVDSATDPGQTQPDDPPLTDPADPSPTDPSAQDPKENIFYYPFPLLQMSAAELEDAYGPLIYITRPEDRLAAYAAEGLGEIQLLFETDEAGSLASTSRPERLLIVDDALIYPGLSAGMTKDEANAFIDWQPGVIESETPAQYWVMTAAADEYFIHAYFKCTAGAIAQYETEQNADPRPADQTVSDMVADGTLKIAWLAVDKG